MPVTVEIPKEKWTGSIRQVTLGATAAQGGTRSKTVTVGGETTLPFLFFEGDIPNPPVVAVEIQDSYPADWSPVLLKAWGDTLQDPAAWARSVVLPAVTVGVTSGSILTRFVRSALLEAAAIGFGLLVVPPIAVERGRRARLMRAIAAGALAANVSLYPKMPYDPVKDFAPVSNVAFVPFLLIANPSLPANNLQELVALASAKPGQLMLGYGGNGTAMHLSGELFKLMARIQLVNVPYKGSGPAAVDTVGGQLPLAMVDVASAIAQVKAGRLKALAVTTRKRISAAPDVPTFAEQGLPDYEATGWFGVVMPAGTPAEIVGRMNAELVAALQRKEIIDRVTAAGAEPSPSTPEEFGALIRSEIAKWGEVVKLSGAKVD